MSVFERVREFLRSIAPLATDTGREFPYDTDLWVATVTLLLEMAYGDAEFDPTERMAIRHAIEREFGILKRDALELMESAERARAEGGDLGWIAAMLRERYDESQLVRIIALLWKVGYADRVLERFEESFAERVTELLGLSPEQGARARAMARRGEV